MNVVVTKTGDSYLALCDGESETGRTPTEAIGLLVLNNFNKFGITDIAICGDARDAELVESPPVDEEECVPPNVPTTLTPRRYGHGVSSFEMTIALVSFLKGKPNREATRQETLSHMEMIFTGRFTETDWKPEPQNPNKWMHHWHHRVDTVRNTLRRQGGIYPVHLTGLGVWRLTPAGEMLAA